MLTLRELTQNKLPLAVSEKLQSGIELTEDSPGGNKASLGAAWRGRPLGGLFPERPLFLLYLAKCDCSTKGFHQIEYSVIVSWENPTPLWAIYLQIILKMAFIRVIIVRSVI